MKKQRKFRMGKQRQKNRSKIGFGRVLGPIWEGFGTVWAVLWLLLDAFWPSLGLRCGTWRLLGVILSILGALERVLAAIFGQSRVLKQFFQDLSILGGFG